MFFKITSLPKMNSSSVFLVEIVSLAVLAYVLISTFYNILFHPLRKYPGPVIHKITNLCMSYHDIRGKAAYHVRDLHEKYGSTVRVGPNELSYIDEQAWNDIYGHKSKNGTGNLPREEKRSRPEKNNKVTILNANEADHQRLRRIQTPLFSDRAIAAQEELIIRYCELLTSRLMERTNNSSNSIDMVLWYTYITFDIFGELAFGKPFNGLTSNSLDTWIQDSRNAWARRYELAARKISDRVIRDLNSPKTDLISHIVQYNDEKGMTEAEIQSNARILIIAGNET
ncbi:Cytochrome P450 monooxygenase aclL [Golovinomyces cichoracearum]|uniref:Cytochrome P450 monooxygenase aclL n=1 Tax=Golovinomyces cichoracearum TaxID=62708 RepID=A0A420INB6_9PEZI|nr:Cytochrome P450 monooxygenase aclL [Golovinomyces cichoracearum]